ncbi:DUF397 domain-containing protein [Streptomyces niger]|uniref:DUF397 domain-containing protein n=1 Tax=Streptomyces niger TaxID=66373 RepID=UPI0006993188|nr:DUF397 domain-containing protein [Streptomyces niger]
MSTDLQWFKSSYSGTQGECVEVAVEWIKSSYSGSQGGDCVEVAVTPSVVHVRDSKDIARPGVTVSPDAWDSFTSLIRVDSKALAVESWSTRS